jgi:hypothetical protein
MQNYRARILRSLTYDATGLILFAYFSQRGSANLKGKTDPSKNPTQAKEA